jgi:hypothetical protein
VEAKRSEAAEMEGMSNDELEREWRAEVEKLIRESPELAIVAAQQLGWTIVPPIAATPV